MRPHGSKKICRPGSVHETRSWRCDAVGPAQMFICCSRIGQNDTLASISCDVMPAVAATAARECPGVRASLHQSRSLRAIRAACEQTPGQAAYLSTFMLEPTSPQVSGVQGCQAFFNVWLMHRDEEPMPSRSPEPPEPTFTRASPKPSVPESEMTRAARAYAETLLAR